MPQHQHPLSLREDLRAHLSFTRRLLVTSTTQKCELSLVPHPLHSIKVGRPERTEYVERARDVDRPAGERLSRHRSLPNQVHRRMLDVALCQPLSQHRSPADEQLSRHRSLPIQVQRRMFHIALIKTQMSSITSGAVCPAIRPHRGTGTGVRIGRHQSN